MRQNVGESRGHCSLFGPKDVFDIGAGVTGGSSPLNQIVKGYSRDENPGLFTYVRHKPAHENYRKPGRRNFDDP